MAFHRQHLMPDAKDPPESGAPRHKRRLALGTLASITLIVPIIFGAATACGDNTKTSVGTAPPPTNSTGPSSSAQPSGGGSFGLAQGTPVTLSNSDNTVTVAVNSVSELQPGQYDTPPGAGQHYIQADVSYECVEGQCPYNPLYWSARQPDGTTSDSVLLIIPENGLSSGTLSSGNRVRGNVPFEVPTGSSGTIVLTSVLGQEQASWQY